MWFPGVFATDNKLRYLERYFLYQPILNGGSKMKRFWKYIGLIVLMSMLFATQVAAAPYEDKKPPKPVTPGCYMGTVPVEHEGWMETIPKHQECDNHGRNCHWVPEVKIWHKPWTEPVKKEICPAQGCYFVFPEKDGPGPKAEFNHPGPKPEPKPAQVCPSEFAYPNFQNDICIFCAPPDLTKLVSWEVQKPKDDNDVTVKTGGTRDCSFTDATHNAVNDGGNWIIPNGQWILANGDYYAESKFRDAFALKADAMCAVYTDPGKIGQTFHQGVLEKNGFFVWRGLPDDTLLLSGAICPQGELYHEADLTSGKLHRARDIVDGKPLVDLSFYTAPNGRTLWNER